MLPLVIGQAFCDSSIFVINGGFSTAIIARFPIEVFNRPILSPLATGLEVLLVTPIGSGATIITMFMQFGLTIHN